MLRRLFLCLILPLSGYAQTTYQGTVSDAGSQLPVAFATVGLIKENTGTTTGEDGHFNLTTSKPQPGDTLLFTALGYQPQKIATAAFSGKVVLVKNVREIGEVSISPKPLLQNAVLNKNGKRSNASYTSSGYISQIAQRFTAPALPALLTAVQICKLHIPIFVSGNGVFRLRIYGLNPETGGPGEDLCTQSIEVKASGSKVEVDLNSYRIFLPQKDFFVAVEWLKIPANEDWYTVKENGKKVRRFGGYWPSVEFSRNETAENNMWHQLYNGEWRKMPYRMNPMLRKEATNFAIEAHVRY